MNRIGVAVSALCILAVLFVAYGRITPLPETPPLEEEPAAASVDGHFEEVNIGDFDLVDGIAWPLEGRGTVIYVTSKLIASSTLTRSACPATMARALTAVRNAGWVEVTLDASGMSKCFCSGTPYGGQMSAAPGRDWSSTLSASGDRVSGGVSHEYGSFEFDLPLSTPRMKEVSEDMRTNQYIHANPSLPAPSAQALTDAYRAAHAAAMKKDWPALLAAVGFDVAQSAAILALPDIDADLKVFANRFLTPGDAREYESREGHGFVLTEGTDGRGAKSINSYWFSHCLDKLVLYRIGENPQ